VRIQIKLDKINLENFRQLRGGDRLVSISRVMMNMYTVLYIVSRVNLKAVSLEIIESSESP
jgi:hypothetical protein